MGLTLRRNVLVLVVHTYMKSYICYIYIYVYIYTYIYIYIWYLYGIIHIYIYIPARKLILAQ